MERSWQQSVTAQAASDVPVVQPECEDPGTVTLLQWNILSQTLGVQGNFLCDKEALQWEHREPLLVQEILRYNADILCLEEVDCFSQLAASIDGPDGFTGVWIPKPRSPCLHFEDNMGPDGNAIFWRKSKFTLVKSYHHVLEGEDGLPTNATVLCCQLEDTKTKENLTVMATHLKAKKGFESVRVAQTKHLLRIIETEKQGRLILTGDFNAGLEEPGYEMVRSAGLESVYRKVLTEEPEYTTWKRRGGSGGSGPMEKKATIDFIFCTLDTVQPCAVLQVPSMAAIGPGLLPSLTFPSDHMSLVARFAV